MGTDKRIASPSPDFRVMIRNAQGHYLARDDHGLFFTNDRAAAMVFDYLADRVAPQLEELQKTRGIALAENTGMHRVASDLLRSRYDIIRSATRETA